MTRTVGVEEEFLLMSPSGSDLVSAGELVARAAARGSDGQFEHELKQEQAELGTDPCVSLPDLVDQLRGRRAELAAAAHRHGARLVALATCPTAHPASTTPDRRYERIDALFGQVALAQLTCGMHVHVSIDSPDEGVAVLDRLRPWLAVLRALSGNSPFWGGGDTSYASYRSILWGQWPTAGPTEAFGDHAGYQQVRDQLIGSGAAMDDGMVYFDARLSVRYGTVEIRVADVCPYVEDAATITALLRALVSTAAADWDAGRPVLAVRAELLRAAAWRAARWGMDDQLVDLETAALTPAWSLVDRLLDQTSTALEATGDRSAVEAGLASIRTRGTGATRQRQVYAEHRSFEAVVDAMAAQTLAG